MVVCMFVSVAQSGGSPCVGSGKQVGALLLPFPMQRPAAAAGGAPLKSSSPGLPSLLPGLLPTSAHHSCLHVDLVGWQWRAAAGGGRTLPLGAEEQAGEQVQP